MKTILRILATAVFVAVFTMPAQAAFAPTYTIYNQSSAFGSPGAPRVIQGYITLSASDTYVTGGFTIAASMLTLQSISAVTFGTPNAAFFAYATTSAGVATVKFNAITATSTSSTPTITSTSSTPTSSTPVISTPTATITSGASQILAAATTATVTGLSGLTINTPVFCQLDDAATGGGGTGTWAVTTAVSSCKYASATSFTITATAAAPAGGGNFTYWIGIPPVISTPTSSTPVISTPTITSTSSTPTITSTTATAELANATSVASVVIPFTAIGY